MVAIYTMLVIATIMSVFAVKTGFGARLAWSLLILCLPVLGIALHCFACLYSADYNFLKQFGFARSKKVGILSLAQAHASIKDPTAKK